MKTCHIVGAGDFFPERFAPAPGELVIAADAGLAHLEALGVTPDLAVGDFDSLGRVPELPNVTVCPVRKDDTDMMIAVRRALELGYRRLLLHGGTGGRLDHTLANLQTLLFAARQGALAFLLGGDFTAAALRDGTLRFAGGTGTFSAFCMGPPARGVYERGFLYPLEDASLTADWPLGVSNSFLGGEAEVSVREGALVLLWQDAPLPEFRPAEP